MNTKTILLILGVCLLIGYAVYYNFYSDNARVNLNLNSEKQYLSDSEYLESIKEKKHIGDEQIIITEEEIYLPDLNIGMDIN
jgi:hypothetical protein